ncbi:hypothetical protein EI555_015750, partial [Monodon monoceros]
GWGGASRGFIPTLAILATRGRLRTPESNVVSGLCDIEREIHAAPHVSDRLIQLFRNKSEFTFLATVQQKPSSSGVILSIRELERSYSQIPIPSHAGWENTYFELESSGLRDEIRYHYIHNGKPRTEALPYRMADGQWHKVSLSVSASHLLLHVDCNSYELLVFINDTVKVQMIVRLQNVFSWAQDKTYSDPDMWQQTAFLEGTGCPGYGGPVVIKNFVFSHFPYEAEGGRLHDAPFSLSSKEGIASCASSPATVLLNYAETRLSQLENCHCEKTCQVSGLLYRDQDSWVDGDHCRNCTCKSGAVECRRMSCPPLNCSPDSLPVHIAGQCCKVCRPKCIYGGKVLAEGQRILTKSCRECRVSFNLMIPITCREGDAGF